ncbi:hypothetical protein Trco_007892 [Trichoderma cornu-damae]|uniref:Nudix hydrolase domain-containing protein n=1 Tax=Trichoderma cornu-damae TaxID=654480 RepID=A0A9P8TRQ4_9HYPO|nr:hypothetical protein Trco_007892 [Trichoderma cornu-damae]
MPIAFSCVSIFAFFICGYVMAVNMPGIVWSAIRALGLDEVSRENPLRFGDPYWPSPVDIAVVRAMLFRSKKLPHDLIDAVFDFAEYWAHSMTHLDESIHIRGGNEERENRFLVSICLRSYPVGLVNAGARQNANDQPYTTALPTPRPLGETLDASFFAKSVKYPTPRLARPVRKIVFTFKSQDQGWASDPGDAESPYSKSWTWFEAGLEKFDASCANDESLPSVSSLRPVHPQIHQTSSDPVGYNYTHQLLHSPEWEIKRNMTAFGKWQLHVVTWSYLDDIAPDSEGGQALEAKGRGRGTGDGKFVRQLQVGDVVTVWGKARFGAWVNHIESVRIYVFWAILSLHPRRMFIRSRPGFASPWPLLPQLRIMSTFKSSPHGIPISLPDGLSESQLKAFKPFTSWIDTLAKSLMLQANASHPFHPDPYALRSVTIQSYDLFGAGRLGFVKLTASVSNSAGETLPAAALLRGPSVAMLVMMVPDDVPPESDERYVVLTVQPRIPVGSLSFVELPAGMVDGSGNFKGVAAREMEEELGITIHEDELTCLSELAGTSSMEQQATDGEGENLAAAMFPSAGGCDEHITIYSYERRIPRSKLSEWEGRLTGVRSHGEKITLKVVPMQHLWKEGARDAKCLAALALWQGLRREKKL